MREELTRSLLVFFAATFVVSWIVFTTAAPGGPLFFAGVFAPSLVALALTAHRDGREGVQRLLGQIVNRPAGARWFVFAAFYMASIKLAAAILHRAIIGAWPVFGTTPIYLMAAATLISTPVQAGEEIGWRGYALPRLAYVVGLAPASVVLGVIWAAWHLPLFFTQASDKFAQSFPLYVVQVTAVSVAMAWLYWRTHGNLLLTMLMHAAVNNTKDIVPSAAQPAGTPFGLNASVVAWLTVALLCTSAGWFLLRMKGGRVDPGHPHST